MNLILRTTSALWCICVEDIPHTVIFFSTTKEKKGKNPNYFLLSVTESICVGIQLNLICLEKDRNTQQLG